MAGQSASSSRTSDAARIWPGAAAATRRAARLTAIAEVIAADGQHLAVAETRADLQSGIPCARVFDQVDRNFRQLLRRRTHPHHLVADELHHPSAVCVHHVATAALNSSSRLDNSAGVSRCVKAVKPVRSANPTPQITLADVSRMTASK